MSLQRVPSQTENDAYAKKEGTLIIRTHVISFKATLVMTKIILGAYFYLMDLQFV